MKFNILKEMNTENQYKLGCLSPSYISLLTQTLVGLLTFIKNTRCNNKSALIVFRIKLKQQPKNSTEKIK